MATPPTQPPLSGTAFWRREGVRAVFYQVLVLAAAVGLGVFIFRNTLENLKERGISSGFAFLKNEAGFGISERLPVPLLQGGVLAFLGALVAGLGITWLLTAYARRRGFRVRDDTRLVVAVAFFLVVVPAIALYLGWPSLRSVTYQETSNYGVALVTGLLNTVKVSLLGCVLASLLGMVIGVARLSSNWLVAKLATAYIELIRNIPLLLQIFFWYFAVIRSLPSVRQSLVIQGVLVLNNRGVFLPEPLAQPAAGPFLLAVLAAVLAIYFWARYVAGVRERTGRQLPVFYPGLGVLIVLPGLAWLAAGRPFVLDFPVLQGFNYQGGLVLTPEYAAMLVALVMYTTAFIAEIVRSGIEAISKGQREAALAVGLRGSLVLRLVILPQALRVIIPPLTSQYLNLTKNSSLGVAIGYPEIVSVGGTILNQSGQAIEVIGITMAVYLTFSLLISLFMNWYNERVKLIER
jgi:general L-amino acid transport system permease protein